MTEQQMDGERLRFARLRWVGRVRSRVACTVREAELALEHLVRLGHASYRAEDADYGVTHSVWMEPETLAALVDLAVDVNSRRKA